MCLQGPSAMVMSTEIPQRGSGRTVGHTLCYALDPGKGSLRETENRQTRVAEHGAGQKGTYGGCSGNPSSGPVFPSSSLPGWGTGWTQPRASLWALGPLCSWKALRGAVWVPSSPIRHLQSAIKRQCCLSLPACSALALCAGFNM